MKKSIILLCLFLMSGILSNAQNFGIQGGFNLSSLNFEEDISTSGLAGFEAGVVYDLPLSETAGFNTALLYVHKGCKIGEGEDEAKIHLNYLEIPLNLALFLNLSDQSKIFVQAGPYLGIGLSGKEKDSDGDESDLNFGSGDDDDLKRMDLGLNLGAGLQLSSVRLAAKYGLGLTNINNSDGSSVKNNGFAVSVSVFF